MWIDIIKNVEKKFKNFKVKEIEDYSHNEKGYIETKLGKNISYEYAFDLSIDV